MIKKIITEKCKISYYMKEDNENDYKLININELNNIRYKFNDNIWRKYSKARSIENLKTGNFLVKNIFKYEFLYETLLLLINEIEKEINNRMIYIKDPSKYKIFLTGNSSLICNLEEYKNDFNCQENLKYRLLFEMSDVDCQIIINKNNNDKADQQNIIRSICQKYLYKYKQILIKDTNFKYYLKKYIINYINEEKKFKEEHKIKEIIKIQMNDLTKYENINFKSKWHNENDDYSADIMIRINEKLKITENIPIFDLYRLAIPYKIIYSNGTKDSIFAEIVDITIKTNEEEINTDQIEKDVENIVEIFKYNIKRERSITIDDMPKTNKIYNITSILNNLYEKDNNNKYIKEINYKDIIVKSITLEGYIYESALIILSSPEDPKIDKRIERLEFIIKLLMKEKKI